MSPPRPNGIDLLCRKLARYAPLSAEESAALHALPVRMQDYGRGEVIVNQGAKPDESAIVVSGVVFRFKLLTDGLRQIVAMQVPGDFTDLHSFVLRPLDHAIAAASPARLARVPHAAIQTLLERHPRLVRALMWDMALDAAISREWLATLGRRSAYQQLAHLFCELYLRMDWAGLTKDGSLEFMLTQADLGDACGLSTVHVNRSLQSLRKDDLIVLENHILHIPSIDQLCKAAGFDPAYLHFPEIARERKCNISTFAS
jgi:CRP-like cAMP-binding protein